MEHIGAGMCRECECAGAALAFAGAARDFAGAARDFAGAARDFAGAARDCAGAAHDFAGAAQRPGLLPGPAGPASGPGRTDDRGQLLRVTRRQSTHRVTVRRKKEPWISV